MLFLRFSASRNLKYNKITHKQVYSYRLKEHMTSYVFFNYLFLIASFASRLLLAFFYFSIFFYFFFNLADACIWVGCRIGASKERKSCRLHICLLKNGKKMKSSKYCLDCYVASPFSFIGRSLWLVECDQALIKFVMEQNWTINILLIVRIQREER